MTQLSSEFGESSMGCTYLRGPTHPTFLPALPALLVATAQMTAQHQSAVHIHSIIFFCYMK
jgi:hypothetical protein